MEKLFATYEIAKKLKELGFDEPCLGRWNKHSVYNGEIVPVIICITTPKNSEIANSSLIAAPTWQQVIDWLLEKHLIFITVQCEEWLHTFCGKIEDEDGFIETEDTNDYHEALTKAIEEALKLITKK